MSIRLLNGIQLIALRLPLHPAPEGPVKVLFVDGLDDPKPLLHDLFLVKEDLPAQLLLLSEREKPGVGQSKVEAVGRMSNGIGLLEAKKSVVAFNRGLGLSKCKMRFETISFLLARMNRNLEMLQKKKLLLIVLPLGNDQCRSGSGRGSGLGPHNHFLAP